MKQMFRNITGSSKSAEHVDFWLGGKLNLPYLTSSFHHIKGRARKERDNNPPLFLYAFQHITEALDKSYVTVSDLPDITTKEIYNCFIEDLPSAAIEQKYTDRNWGLIWKRLDSGVFDATSRSILYLIIHERVNTKDRGNRLMPGRYKSPECPRCTQPGILMSRETSNYRYFHCNFVSEAWEWLKNIILSLDNSLAFSQDDEILSLSFTGGVRDNAIMWLLGVYVDLVEKQVVIREQKLNVQSLKGVLRQRKQMCKYRAMPDLGIIPELDWDPQGIG